MCPAEWRILPTRCTSEYTVRTYMYASPPSTLASFLQDASARFRLEFILEHPRFNPSAAQPNRPPPLRPLASLTPRALYYARCRDFTPRIMRGVKRSRNPRAIPLRRPTRHDSQRVVPVERRGEERRRCVRNARVYKYRRGPHMLRACVQCELTTARGIPSRNKTATCASTRVPPILPTS